jgi:hypothetical protein
MKALAEVYHRFLERGKIPASQFWFTIIFGLIAITCLCLLEIK